MSGRYTFIDHIYIILKQNDEPAFDSSRIGGQSVSTVYYYVHLHWFVVNISLVFCYLRNTELKSSLVLHKVNDAVFVVVIYAWVSCIIYRLLSSNRQHYHIDVCLEDNTEDY